LPVEYDPKNFTRFRRFWELLTASAIQSYYNIFYGRLTIRGRENVPKDGKPLLIVGNHLSNWDPPMLVVATRRNMGFVAKEELFVENPKFGKLIEYYGAISVKRDKPEKATFKSVKKIFESGWSVGMFIEGTRNKTPGIMGKPHLGPAYFARANKVQILPVGILGTNQKGGHAILHIGKPMDPGEDLEETTWRIMEALSELTGFRIESKEIAH
jgi:1-acyl-sn-glycerol-3-phosphate acyltransferase